MKTIVRISENYSVKEVFDACERVLKKKIPVEVKGR